MKINFKQFQVYPDLSKNNITILNVAEELANGIYKTAQGIAGYSLAMKIYNSEGETEYNNDEFNIIKNYADMYGTPFFVDALLKIWEDNNDNSEPTTVESTVGADLSEILK